MKILLFFIISLSITTLSAEEIFQSMELENDQSISIEVSKSCVEEAIHRLKNVKTRWELQSILTSYVDIMFKKLGEFFATKCLNPYQMPDIREGFDYYVVSGEISLTNGRLQGLQTIHRGGDIILTYGPTSSNIITLIIPIAFDELPFVYDYTANFMHIGPHGKIRGTISKLLAKACVQFDLTTNQASFSYLRLLNSENIDINFSGYVLTDWVLNLFVGVATRIIKRCILLIMEIIGQRPIRSVIDSINEILRNILGNIEE